MVVLVVWRRAGMARIRWYPIVRRPETARGAIALQWCRGRPLQRLAERIAMPSPFPGLDPHIEAQRAWQGFHNAWIA
jgi:hypothetical protein